MQKLPPHVLRWLFDRGLTEEVIADAGLHIYSHRIAIPVTKDNGRTFNKYRRDPAATIGDKYGTDPGGKRTLYRWDKEKDAGVIVICEGELDALRVVSDGGHAVSSTAGSKGWDKKWGARFVDKTAIIWLDNDEAGIEGTERVASSVSEFADKTYVVRHDPKHGKDLTNYLCSTGQGFSVDMLKKERDLTFTKYVHKPNVRIKRERKGEMPPLEVVMQAYGVHLEKENSVICCMFHDDHSPSLSVSLDVGLFHCFGCGVAGDAYSFIMLKEDCSFLEAKEILSKL